MKNSKTELNNPIYPITNESLKAIELGLDLKEGHIFGILGSGDMRYFCLSKNINGNFVDHCKKQIDYVISRDNHLKNENFQNFAAYNLPLEYDPLANKIRDEFFSKLNFGNIKKNLNFGKIFKEDYFFPNHYEINLSKYNKFYLSNALEHKIKEINMNQEKIFFEFCSKISVKSLIYFVANPILFKKGDYNFKNLEKNGLKFREDLTNLAKKESRWWIPQVYAKII